MIRKFSANPFIPLGVLVTCGFLASGLKAFRDGNKRRSQLMMRGRVVAQALTVTALGLGTYFNSQPANRPLTMEDKMEKEMKEKVEYEMEIERATRAARPK